jgi:hypothetical protein
MIFGKKHSIVGTIEIPYEFEVPFNVKDLDDSARQKLKAFFEAEFHIPYDAERMNIRVEDNIDENAIGI